MLKSKLFFTLLILFYTNCLIAQNSRIAGKITDEITGQPLQDVHIFIPNTTFQSFSDSLGNFLISNVPDGKWEIQVWGHGWETHREVLVLKARILKNLDIKLAQNSGLIPAGEALSKGQQSKVMDQLMAIFVGADFKNQEIAVLNPDKFIFEKLQDKNFRVHSIGPIFFSNNETGYLVSTYFKPFVLVPGARLEATYSYFELPSNDSELAVRRKIRMRIYEDSPQKFLSQLMTGELGGFEGAPNPEVSFSENAGDFLLTFAKPLTVKLSGGRIGMLDFKGEKLPVKFNGAPVSSGDLDLGGSFMDLNPIVGLPANFNADKLIKLANLERTAETMEERIFVHTDRKHYWPGENLFFKAYFKYGNPILAEDLSKVLHIELLDSTGHLWLHRIFEVKNGLASGHLPLPDLQESGNFILRAYTAWGQNYQEADFYLPIQILGHQFQPANSTIQEGGVGVGVFSDKQEYTGGEKVRLTIMALNSSGNPINAHLSVSVLDMNQAVFIPEAKTMEESFLPKSARTTLDKFSLRPEKGFSLQGHLLDDRGLTVEGNLKAFINGYTDIRTLKTDKSGNFELPPSNFEESFEIALQATDREARPVRDISLAIKNYPTERFPRSFEFPAIVPRGIQPSPDIQALQGLAAGEILLEEALIEDKRELSIGPMIYGRPDKVVKTEDLFLNGTAIQFLYALAGQVPGMTVYGTPPAIRFRGGEPLVLINGAPVNSAGGGTFGNTGGGQTAYDVISNLDVFSIERVEVIRRLVPQYGDQGRNGIISIILKTGPDRAKAIEASMNNYTLFEFRGFPKVQSFEEVETNRAGFPFLFGYKPTLYWNANLLAQESRMSQAIEFNLNEKTGPILVEIRGISDLGEPIHGTFLLNAVKLENDSKSD